MLKDKSNNLRLFICGLLIAFGALFLISPTFCAPLQGVVEDMYEAIFNPDFGIEGILTLSDGTMNSVFSTSLAYAESIYNGTIRTIGICLMLMYWMIYLFQTMSTTQNMTLEIFTKSFARLAIGVFFIYYAMDLMHAILGFANALIAELASYKPSSVNPNYNPPEFSQNNLFENIGLIFAYFVPQITVIICSLFAKLIAYSRIFEIVLRIMFGPLVMGDIFSGNENAAAIRWLRNFMACCLSGAIMIVVLQLYTIFKTAAPTVGDNAWMMVLYCFICIALLFKSNSFAKEVCGV